MFPVVHKGGHLSRSLDSCVMPASHISPLKTEIQGVMGGMGGGPLDHNDIRTGYATKKEEGASTSFHFLTCEWGDDRAVLPPGVVERIT